MARRNRRRPGWSIHPGVGRLLRLAAAAALLAGAVGGCSAVARHQVLTFFFTGVPPLGSVEKTPEPVAKAKTRTVARPGSVVKATRFGHGPYAANLCFSCHQVSASGGFRGFGKQDAAKDAIAGAGQVSGQLLAPMGELCSSCHTGKSPARAQAAGLWVHGPVATGYCVMCHAPHAAPQPYLLQKASNALCVECHSDASLISRTTHQGRPDCVSCHNAHLGKDNRMLRAELRESW
ncbi:MAG: cytochrome c3 family protein [Burkholderiaceae bacterium]|nr:cytochrome c3 family protein [Burkholderiaceae bacterium]